MVPKFCRVALLVKDMAGFTEEMGRLLGTSFFRPRMIEEQYGGAGFDVMFGEHGIDRPCKACRSLFILPKQTQKFWAVEVWSFLPMLRQLE
jgi:hypothetical protein